jgi:hypothetical protein
MLYLSGWVVATLRATSVFLPKAASAAAGCALRSRGFRRQRHRRALFFGLVGPPTAGTTRWRVTAVKYSNQSICYREETERSFRFVEYVGDYYYRVSSLMRLWKLLGFSKMIIFEKPYNFN